MSRKLSRYVSCAKAMARNCSVQARVRTRRSPPWRSTLRAKVLQGRKSINWANSVLPGVMGGAPRDSPQNCPIELISTPPDFREKPLWHNAFQRDRYKLTGQQWKALYPDMGPNARRKRGTIKVAVSELRRVRWTT